LATWQHDCDNNCELFREGRYITFRVLRPISIGEEITAHYGDGYCTCFIACLSTAVNFVASVGRRNRHCLCETCEKNGRGGYAPDHTDDEAEQISDSSSDSDSDSDSDTSTSDSGSAIEEEEERPLLNLNERRTRRGVYAVFSRKEDDSDESENEEDNKVPLADAEDIPADGEIELTAEVDTVSELTSLPPSAPLSDAPDAIFITPSLTPDPDRLSRSSSSLTSLSSSSTDLPGSPCSAKSTPYRSIISTRRQRAKVFGAGSITSENRTPSDSATFHDNLSTPSKHATRSVSSVLPSGKLDKGKGKEIASRTPTSTPTSNKILKGNASVKDDIKIKKEELENRVLRSRPSVLGVTEAVKGPPAKPEIPRGPDGKLLPVCSTCFNVLPVIQVDSKIVWGLSIEHGKKKKQKQECPRYICKFRSFFVCLITCCRCLRHFAIYNQDWPSRVPPSGTILLPTPRGTTPLETVTKRVTQKGLSVLDRKLAAAASASSSSTSGRSKKRGREGKDDGARPTKQRKTERVQPTHKVTIKVKKTSTTTPTNDPLSAADQEPPVKRKRGRPRLTSPRYRPKPGKVARQPVANSVQVKVEEKAMDLSSAAQPRFTNGRFGKKDKSSGNGQGPAAGSNEKLSARAERASERGKVKVGWKELEQTPTKAFDSKSTWTSPRLKRPHDDVDESPRKKSFRKTQSRVEGGTGDPVQKVLPRPISGFRGGRLFSNPNPLRFALHAWASPVVLDESSSSEDEKPPVTPEEDLSPAAEIVHPDDDLNTPSFFPAPALPAQPPLIYKPSPLNFSARRWVSLSKPTIASFSDAKGSPETRNAKDDDAWQGVSTRLRMEKHRRPRVGSKSGYASDKEVSLSFHPQFCTLPNQEISLPRLIPPIMTLSALPRHRRSLMTTWDPLH
jgi:histone-lysine N-methyltransferase SUV420H